ncbi:SDR family NAD(P)-dependent oxidoreductase [Halioxenophilus sp. WMMB6]|uniref:SDR family NAD(P)-dependent oxidoreductase n=1 Tax=Halioxenophilus sp. WMMB6 TaxID=3073815 RepID=UPI00295E8016|nr:SDR family NAD(P)-dependent oxidoreductase [Halioxenophilus sp. WMMB6]
MSDSFDLTGRIALVTGASSGLGCHFAKVLAEHGASVVLAARRVERLQGTVAAIESAGGKALAVALDVTDSDSIQTAFEQIEGQCGVVDLLVNNAGVAASKRFVKTENADWDFVINTNLKAVWEVARECSRRLVAAGKPGSIVNIASILGLQPGFGESLYSTSKAAVVQLTKNMALELIGSGIRVNALCPGYFETEMNSDFFASEKGANYIAGIPPKRLGNLSELNGPLLLLASDAGSFVNGVALPVDGGHLVQSL